MKQKLALSLAALLLPLSAAAAIEPAAPDAGEPRALGVESSIVFPNDSTIRNWQADRERGIWIEGARGEWYYGSFAGTCRDLNFAEAIGVETRGISRLDKFGTLIVRGERCQLTSFVTSAPPPSKKDRKPADKAAQN
ncbi:hypothetical protein FHR22_002710 [Sphingopyxis panaciterrae]|uniref:DUF6491 family protein n=1 Tax=Sphingopyxis panaciterrae TaxID=363841 RepID=UPI001FBA70C3|nr:DUF6491 family protein [Sphingopyxis panaciterrae]NIJ38007.1 hypothetical protein [Sphingopyxis panaciterrae]